jgi:ariadne-1
MDVQFLKAATEQVFECRNVLKYTYVFAYYLKDGPEKTLFEYLQQVGTSLFHSHMDRIII